ncbi:MAG: M55 family metallopeptidase [Bacilli bacterium]|nr:M55 family metallopeptidase [Bacilli bacterium]
MKVFISCDIEGVNNIISWDETGVNSSEYNYFRKQMTDEVKFASLGAKDAGADLVFVKDAHDWARNLILSDLPEFVTLHRGWEGCPCSMMAGLDETFDAVIFIGYHSPAGSDGNPLAHTMNLKNSYVKINGVLASEFYINALYAAYLKVPVAFLSGDLNLTQMVKEVNENIATVATKEGRHGAVVSRHPNITNELIKKEVNKVLQTDLKNNIIKLPQSFEVEIKYKKFTDAYNASFYPGCELIQNDTIIYRNNDYYEVLRALKFIL